MTLTLKQLTDDLSGSGLVSAEALRAIDGALPADGRPTEAEDLTRALVRSGYLTKFQAHSALQGKARQLVYGEYVLLDQLDTAGATKVFKAEHRRLKRVVALRLFSRSTLNTPAAVRNFHEVVQAAARLVHPNVVATQDAGESGGVHFIVMEYVDGHNLTDVSRERGPLPIADAVHYVEQAARALDYAHERGVVHGDVKPSNLLLHHDGTIKVLEVGLSHLDQPGADRREVPVSTGLSCLAPEQRLDLPHADARSDVYALGCVLYTLLAGASPLAVAGGSAPAGPSLSNLRGKRHDLPEALAAVLEKMTASRAADRFAAMKDVLAALKPFGPTNGKHPVAGGHGASAVETATLSGASSTAPLGRLGEAVTLEKSKHLVAKFVGGISATIIAPVVVALVLKYMDNSQPPPPPAADGKSAAATEPRPADAAKPGSATADASRTARPTAAQPEDSAPGPKAQLPPSAGNPATNGGETATVAGPGSPAADPDAQAGDWQDVIPTIYPPLDVLRSGEKIGANRWELQADGLHYLTDGKAGRLRLPVEIRGRDLEFEIDFTPLEAKAAFGVSAPFANGFVWINFGGDGRADLSGKRQYPLTIAQGKRMKINLHLFRDRKDDRIVATADGKEILRWSGDGKDLARPFAPLTIPDAKTTTLWCAPPAMIFHRYRVRGRNSSMALARRGSAPPPARFPFDAAAAHSHQEAWARYLGEPLEFVNNAGIKFALIPPGEFQMGLSPAEAEALAKIDPSAAPNAKLKEQLSPHKVAITRPFYLATTETTIEQFRKFLTAAEYKTQSEQRGAKVNWHAPGYAHKPRFPVTEVAFQDLAAMCNWLNDSEKLPHAYDDKFAPLAAPGPQYRIPTEAEWEYACRAGTQTLWWLGNDAGQVERAAWVGREEKPVAPSVVAGRRRANPFGLFDMHGNVWEICQDVFDVHAYKTASAEDPAGPGGMGVHVNRGGAADKPALSSYSALRIPNRMGQTGNMTGFRVLKEF